MRYGPLQVADRLLQLVHFRHGHESLRSVITIVAKTSEARALRGSLGGRSDAMSGVQSGALDVLKEAYDVVRAVDALDTRCQPVDFRFRGTGIRKCFGWEVSLLPICARVDAHPCSSWCGKRGVMPA